MAFASVLRFEVEGGDLEDLEVWDPKETDNFGYMVK